MNVYSPNMVIIGFDPSPCYGYGNIAQVFGILAPIRGFYKAFFQPNEDQTGTEFQCQVAGYDTAENYLPPEEFPREKQRSPAWCKVTRDRSCNENYCG